MNDYLFLIVKIKPKWQQFKDYCIRDVDAASEISGSGCLTASSVEKCYNLLIKNLLKKKSVTKLILPMKSAIIY